MDRFRLLSLAAPLILIGASASQDANEAQALYRRMEKAMAGLKGVDIKVDATSTWTLDGVPLNAALTGRFLFQEQARLRVEMTGSVREIDGDSSKKFKIEIVSDGKGLRMRSDGTGLKPRLEEKVLPGLRRRLESLLLPSPIFFLSDSLGEEFMSQEESYVDITPSVSGFHPAGREKVGGREARKLSYLLELGAEGYATSEYRVTLWIDAATGLPLRRETGPRDEEATDRMVETFEIVRDPKIDPKRFELPAEE